jgi:hypothetical protein
MKGTGISLLIGGFLLAEIVSERSEVPVFITFLPLIMILLGAFLFWRGRQYAAASIADQVIGDLKPDVLYLRDFQTDPSLLGYMRDVLFFHNRIRSAISGTEEEQLYEALEPFGDLIAIGKPGETLPTPGAARLYPSDDEWKKVVAQQMQSARLVVIRAGSGEGLTWELRQAAQALNPKKILILILKMKKKKYEAFRKEAEATFQSAFPKAGQIGGFWRVSGFVRFSIDWKPDFLVLRIPYYRRSVYKPYRRLFKFALKPVFQEYGLEWKPPPLAKSRVMFLVVLGLIIFLVLIACFHGLHCNWESWECHCG